MQDVVISAESLGKEYVLGEGERYRALRDSVNDLLLAPVRLARGAIRPGRLTEDGSVARDRTIWALKDVSFDVRMGEVVGIIGRNGAGKSTLLKIFAGITEPTRGLARIRGRVGTLLEVGTGFHPELTGRENVYLNGAILGMRKQEIRRRFDEIVSFAELERFVDTPVKRYSTGMEMRLAFAVAAHLEPEILVIDEVLAVGDARFQRKCVDKVEDVSRQGRTVLFVSHNMAAVTRLCERTILLDRGHIIDDGPSHRVVTTYLRSGLGTIGAREWEPAEAPGNDVVRLRGVRVRTVEGAVTEVMDIRRPVGIEMEYDVLEPGHVLVPNIHVLNEEGAYVFVAHDLDPIWRGRPRDAGRYVSTAWIPSNFLAEGTFIVGTAVSTMLPVVVHFFERDAVAFQVVDTLEGDSARGDYAGPIPGSVRPLLDWDTRFEPPTP